MRHFLYYFFRISNAYWFYRSEDGIIKIDGFHSDKARRHVDGAEKDPDYWTKLAESKKQAAAVRAAGGAGARVAQGRGAGSRGIEGSVARGRGVVAGGRGVGGRGAVSSGTQGSGVEGSGAKGSGAGGRATEGIGARGRGAGGRGVVVKGMDAGVGGAGKSDVSGRGPEGRVAEDNEGQANPALATVAEIDASGMETDPSPEEVDAFFGKSSKRRHETKSSSTDRKSFVKINLS